MLALPIPYLRRIASTVPLFPYLAKRDAAAEMGLSCARRCRCFDDAEPVSYVPGCSTLYSLKFDTLPTRYHLPSRFWYSSIQALVNSTVSSCLPGAVWTPRA